MLYIHLSEHSYGYALIVKITLVLLRSTLNFGIIMYTKSCM